MLFPEFVEIVDAEPRGAALNMALDEALAELATEPILRFYRWSRPAVSFGCFGRIADLEALKSDREIVRRWTGGGIVLHGADITYSVLAPASSAFFRETPLASYRLIHEVVAEALRRSGVESDLAPAAQAKMSEACFENPTRFDVLAAGRKAAGAAQRRTRRGLLHQGSIQVAADALRVRVELAALLGLRRETRGFTSAEMATAQRLVAEKYGSEEWLRRR